MFQHRFLRKFKSFYMVLRLLLGILVVIGMLANSLSALNATNVVPNANIRAEKTFVTNKGLLKHTQTAPRTDPIPPFEKKEITSPPDVAAPEPEGWSAPGSLTLKTSHYLLSPGKPFTLTVRVLEGPSDDIIGNTVQIHLSPALKVISGDTSWSINEVRSNGISEYHLILQTDESSPDSVYKIEATLSRTGRKDQRRGLLLGKSSPNNPISVLLDPSDQDISITIRPLDNFGGFHGVGPNSAPPGDETTGSANSASTHLYLPFVVGGSNIDAQTTFEQGAPPPGWNSSEDSFVGKWEIQAMLGGQEIHQLPHPATLVISAETIIRAGIDPYQLQLFTRESDKDKWKPVRVEYRPEEQIFVARVNHFSQWGLGDGLSASGELIPSVKSFSADGFTGYAQIGYPIETPPGLGGMRPELQLGYSSGTADDMHNHNGDYSYEVQASWVGHGWSLNGLYYIVRDFGANKYMLVLNGISTEIVRTGNTNTDWRTDPEQFLQIDHWYPSSTVGYYRYDVDDWIIHTKDGMTYYFGSNQWDGDQEPIGNWTEVIFQNLYLSNGWKSVRTGSKWWLKAIEDPMGNRMEFTYDTEIDWIGGECLRHVNNQPWWPPDKRFYDRTTYLREIRWSGNPSQSIPYRMRVLFHRQNRPDWKVYGWDKRCVQARFGKQRLQEIEVQVWDAVANNWHTQRRYRLYYVQNELHSLLDRIESIGKDGQSILHTYRMTYSGGYNIVRLKTIDNGWGGTSEYTYGYEEIGDCHDCYGQGWASGDVPQVRPVSEIKHRDGVGNMTRIAYTYAGVRGHMVDGSYEYLGHEWNRQDTYTNNPAVGVSNRLEQRMETWYHQRLNSTTVDPRRGKAHHQRIFSSSGAKFQETVTYWGYTSFNGRYWIHKDREDTYIYDWDGNDRSKVQKNWFFYDANTGNLVRQEERASNGSTVLRKTVTDYASFSSRYILDRPSRIRTYDGSGSCIQEVRHSYDGYGRLIRSDQPTRWCGDSHSSYTIVTRKSYDAFGNVIREWVDGTSRDIRTIYDGVLHVFPVRRYNNSHPYLDETVEYYGVNGGISAGDSRGYWGATKRFCGIDNICTYQSYDVFGRPSARWERGVGWSDVTKAQTRWFYFPYGYSGSQANIVVEWHHPRCQGNFSRKLYNGFGELIQEQGPDENWTTNMDGCNPGTGGGEVVVTHAYDGLGRKIRTSTPRPRPQWNWNTSAPWSEDWSNGYTEITYDPIGRTRTERSSNGTQRTYYYAYRDTSVVAEGINENDRLVSWSHQDELGRTTLLRSYRWENNSWIADAEVQLGYDGGDRLTKVERRDGNSGAWTLLTTLTYDLAGRKTGMWDADLSNWSYSYDKLGQLTRQTDARNKSTCMSYNALGQVTSKVVYDSGGCSGNVAARYAYIYDSYGRLSQIQRTAGSPSWSRNLVYDSLGRPVRETVTIDGIARTLETVFDAWNRPYATRYPDGEVVKVDFNSMGLPKLMCRAYWNSGAGAYWCKSEPWLVSDAHYDAAGRVKSMKFPAGGNLWRTQSYYGWTESKNGGLLKEIKVGTTNGGSNRFYRKYSYNSFGDVATLQEGGTTWSFGYDTLGRLTSAYNKTYSYWPSNRIHTFEGKSFGYNNGHPYHAVKSDSQGNTYSYDANGNLVSVVVGASLKASFTWNAENRLVQAARNGVTETYAYNVDGARIKKVGGVTTRTWFPVYEEENGTPIKYYVFNGMTIAVQRGSSLYYLHADHLSSTSLTTNTGGGQTASRTYYAYGSTRTSSGTLQTDRTYTGQKQDGTGLLYYNARYYDPALGTFLSPDTLVPDAGAVIDYNRYLYARGNPLKYADPSGHCPAPPKEKGPTICVALFIKPPRVSAGPFTLHGDGRDFSNNSDPSQSRGYVWIDVNTGEAETHMNPSGYIYPASIAGHEAYVWTEPSEKNTWSVSKEENGSITVQYDLVVSGPLDKMDAAPHINGMMTFQPNGKGGWEGSFIRDGFPWAEAYYHDGKGNVQTIFQDPAVRGNPHDLFAIEPGMNWRSPIKPAVKWFENFKYGDPQISSQ